MFADISKHFVAESTSFLRGFRNGNSGSGMCIPDVSLKTPGIYCDIMLQPLLFYTLIQVWNLGDPYKSRFHPSINPGYQSFWIAVPIPNSLAMCLSMFMCFILSCYNMPSPHAWSLEDLAMEASSVCIMDARVVFPSSPYAIFLLEKVGCLLITEDAHPKTIWPFVCVAALGTGTLILVHSGPFFLCSHKGRRLYPLLTFKRLCLRSLNHFGSVECRSLTDNVQRISPNCPFFGIAEVEKASWSTCHRQCEPMTLKALRYEIILQHSVLCFQKKHPAEWLVV